MKPERIQKLHTTAPAWHWDNDAHTLRRRFVYPTAAVAQSFARFVLDLAEARRTYPRVSVEQGAVEVVFALGPDPSATELPFEMAIEIEEGSLERSAPSTPGGREPRTARS